MHHLPSTILPPVSNNNIYLNSRTGEEKGTEGEDASQQSQQERRGYNTTGEDIGKAATSSSQKVEKRRREERSRVQNITTPAKAQPVIASDRQSSSAVPRLIPHSPLTLVAQHQLALHDATPAVHFRSPPTSKAHLALSSVAIIPPSARALTHPVQDARLYTVSTHLPDFSRHCERREQEQRSPPARTSRETTQSHQHQAVVYHKPAPEGTA